MIFKGTRNGKFSGGNEEIMSNDCYWGVGEIQDAAG